MLAGASGTEITSIEGRRALFTGVGTVPISIGVTRMRSRDREVTSPPGNRGPTRKQIAPQSKTGRPRVLYSSSRKTWPAVVAGLEWTWEISAREFAEKGRTMIFLDSPHP